MVGSATLAQIPGVNLTLQTLPRVTSSGPLEVAGPRAGFATRSAIIRRVWARSERSMVLFLFYLASAPDSGPPAGLGDKRPVGQTLPRVTSRGGKNFSFVAKILK